MDHGAHVQEIARGAYWRCNEYLRPGFCPASGGAPSVDQAVLLASEHTRETGHQTEVHQPVWLISSTATHDAVRELVSTPAREGRDPQAFAGSGGPDLRAAANSA